MDRPLRSRGFEVLAPAYPGFEVEVEALNADPSPVLALTVPGIVEHLESVVAGLERPPILIGHSAGGVFTQIDAASAVIANNRNRKEKRLYTERQGGAKLLYPRWR